MGAPLIVIFLFLKKYVVYNLYQTANSYGYHRVYRRLLESLRDNKKLNFSHESNRRIKAAIKEAIRFPTTAMDVIVRPEVVEFLNKSIDYISQTSNNKLPTFMVTFASLLVKQTPFGSVLDFLNSKKKP